MSKQLGDRMPEEVLTAFDGQDIESKIGRAYLLVTNDEDGTPRPCMLSAGEVLAPDERRLRVALWPGTNTSKNLARGGRVLFCYIAPGSVIYVKGTSIALGPAPDSKLDRFEITPDRVESDIHHGMPVKETVIFSIEGMDTGKVVADWTAQIDALRA